LWSLMGKKGKGEPMYEKKGTGRGLDRTGGNKKIGEQTAPRKKWQDRLVGNRGREKGKRIKKVKAIGKRL